MTRKKKQKYNYLYLSIYIGYGGHQLRLKCAQVHHQSPAGTFTGPGGGVFVDHRPPRGPGDPLL